MKYTILLLLFSCALFGQGVTITLHNKTGFDVDSLYFCGQKIGFAKKDTTIIISNFKGLIRDSGLLMGYAFGKIEGKENSNYRYSYPFTSFCGSERESITEGKYTFDLLYSMRDGIYQVYARESANPKH